MPIRIQTRAEGPVTVAKIETDSLETGNVNEFRAAMAPILDRAPHLVVDLSSIEFMDSTGLGAMLSCLRSVKAKEGTLRLFNLSSEVTQLFEMVMMDRVFEVYPDEAAAIEAARATA